MSSLPLDCCTPLAGSDLSEAEAEELERLFRLVADRNRLRILNILARAGAPVCVCEFTATLGLSQPTVSYHLKQLAKAGLLERERRASFVYYALVPGTLARLAAVLEPRSAAEQVTAG